MAASAEAPREFTAEDFASRVARAVEQAPEAGLDRVVVAPAPDLGWLTGHQPRQGPGARHGRLLPRARTACWIWRLPGPRRSHWPPE